MAPVRSRLLGALVIGLIPIAAMSVAAPTFGQTASSSSTIDRWQPFIAEASRRFAIPEAWVGAVMRAESGGLATIEGRPITSHAGAMGLMQVMPATWAELRDRYGLGVDPYDPHDNILTGTAYLRDLYQRYGYPNLFAAYNAGPARLDQHLFDGRPLPDETLAYLAALRQPGFEPSRGPVLPAGTTLFFSLHSAMIGISAPSFIPSSDGLFVPLSLVPEHAP